MRHLASTQSNEFIFVVAMYNGEALFALRETKALFCSLNWLISTIQGHRNSYHALCWQFPLWDLLCSYREDLMPLRADESTEFRNRYLVSTSS